MKTISVTFERRQLGWLCKIGFNFASAGQFTDEYHIVEVARRSWILAFVAARRQANVHVKVHGAKKGERESNGWAA